MNPFANIAGLVWALLPAVVFVLLVALEGWRPLLRAPWRRADWLLNGCGLLVQGLLIPAVSVFLGSVLAGAMPALAGIIRGPTAAFLLSFVALDFLYYCQHRWFHGRGWPLHKVHHSATRLGAWVSARNALAAQPLFVYLLPSALLALLCEHRLAYFAGAMLTASLDLWRHSAVRWPAAFGRFDGPLGILLITPAAHHLHHANGAPGVNFGANLSCWDRAFGTYAAPQHYPVDYGVVTQQSPWRQLLAPWS